MVKRSQKFPLRHYPDFFSSADKVTGRLIRVWFLPQEQTQVAVIVSKKVAPHAVDRNRIKRLLFSLCGKIEPLPRAALVVVALPSLSRNAVETQDIQQELHQLFERIHEKNTKNEARN